MIRQNTWIYDVEVAPNFVGITFIPLNYKNDKFQQIVDTYIKVDMQLRIKLKENNNADCIANLVKDKNSLLKAMNARIFNIYKHSTNAINHSIELLDFFSTERILYGYNSANYDKIILAYLLYHLPFLDNNGYSRKTMKHITQMVYNTSQQCIDYGSGFERNISELYKFKRPFQDYDIQKILYLDKTFVSLKQIGIALRWYRIQTLPYKYDIYLEPDQIEMVNEYNVNDVLITRSLVLNQIEEVLLREELSIEFDSNLYNLSRSSISTRLFSHFYSLFTGLEYKDFKDLRTNRYMIALKPLIQSNISFKSDEFKAALDVINNKVITIGSEDNDSKFTLSVPFNGTIYTMGLGGLHSQDDSNIFDNSDGYIYKDADVTSYYPNGILNVDTYPAHLDRRAFRACIGYIKDSRVTAKHEGKKSKAEGLKITINAAYGKLKDAYSFLYDPKCTYTVTVNLQLYLLILIERLAEVNIQVISANTDGIVSRYKPEQEIDYNRVCKQWEDEFKFELEYVEYEKYIRNDVNNYIAIKKGFYSKLNQGEDVKDLLKNYVKFKGLFIEEPVFNKGYFAPVIAKAINNYFIFGTDYKDFINNYISNNSEKGIYDFCISQKINKKFNMVLKSVVNGKTEIISIQSTNRFYASNNRTTTIVKAYNDKDKELSILAKQGISLFNDYTPSDDYNIDYLFYIRACGRIINGKYKSLKTSKKPRNLSDDGIIKQQLTLF